MSRKLLIVLITMGIMGMVTGLAAKAPPNKITIDKFKKKKSGVEFDHQAHSKKYKVKCVTCHHEVKDKKKQNVSCSTKGCHGAKKVKGKLGGGETSLKKNHYHVNCVGCHKKQKKGPKKCKECHK